MKNIKVGILWFLFVQIIVVIDVFFNHSIEDNFMTILMNSNTIPLLMILGLSGYLYGYISYIKSIEMKQTYTFIERFAMIVYTVMFVNSIMLLIIQRFYPMSLVSILLAISFYLSTLSMLILMFIHMGKSGLKRQTRHLIYLVTLIVLLVLHVRVSSSVLISYMMIGLMLLWQYNYLDPKTRTKDLFIHLKKRTLRK